uniref:C-type lectin domain-containing protein n=1 Tax=Steinernema glaseri TaxID=37863 RepID=A0A1I7XZ25_9BILA
MSALLFLRLVLSTFQFSDPPVSDTIRPISDPSDLFGDGPFCPEVTWNGLQFPKTRACAEAVVRCPGEDEVEGVVVFKCHCETATWPEKANMNNCTHKWIGELDDAIGRNDPVLPIARSLADELTPSGKRVLYGGDVVGSVDIQEKLLVLGRQQLYETEDPESRQQQANDLTKFIGLSGDHLLSSHLRGIWGDLDKKVRISKASSLMRTLEESAILLATFISGTEKKLDYQNWAMEIEVHQPSPEIFSSDAIGKSFPAPNFAGPIPEGAPPMDAPEDSVPMTFTNFSKSPIIKLPSFSILQASASRPPPNVALNQPLMFAAAPPRSGFVDQTPLRLGYYLFTSIGSLLISDNRTIVNSHVIGASVNDPTQSVSLPESSPATFTFYHIKKKGVANPRCVYWDTNTMLWSENGCTLVQTNENFTDCSCNHLTSFAILMDITGSLETALTGSAAVALDFITIIGCALSSICLTLSVLVFSCFRSLWNVRNTIHRNLCLSLLVAELLFVIGINRADNEGVCRGIAVALHYFFLSAFTWMLLEGYQLYLMLIQVFEPDKTRIIVYYIFGYGLAAVVVAISAGISWEHYGTANYCWIDVSTPTIWAFVAPITVVIVINVVFLFIALKVVLSVRSRDRTTSQRVAGWLKGSATLLCLLGITWIFGYLTAVTTAEPAFAYIFTVLNSLQGLLIFVLHVVLNEKVRVTLVRFLRRSFCCIQDPTSSYNSKSYLSSKQRLMNLLRPKEKDSHQSTASSSDSHKSSVSNERTALDPQKAQRTGTSRSVQLEVSLKASTATTGSLHSPVKEADVSGIRRSQNTAERQRMAPVRRKKFPLGATEDDRVDNKETVFIERF